MLSHGLDTTQQAIWVVFGACINLIVIKPVMRSSIESRSNRYSCDNFIQLQHRY